MSDKIDALTATLKKHGYSVTMPRRTVYLALINQEPISIKNLQQRVAPSIDRATVYRTIELFEKLDIVQKLYIGWKYKIELSHTFSHHHHHIVCLSCGKITPFKETAVVSSDLDTVARKAGYKPVGHQIELTGICDYCHKNSRTPAV